MKISVKNGIAEYEDMEFNEFVRWLRELGKHLGSCWKLCVHVEIGVNDDGYHT